VEQGGVENIMQGHQSAACSSSLVSVAAAAAALLLLLLLLCQVDRGDLFVALARNIHEGRLNALSDDQLKTVSGDESWGSGHTHDACYMSHTCVKQWLWTHGQPISTALCLPVLLCFNLLWCILL
jgi:hypothetical protein